MFSARIVLVTAVLAMTAATAGCGLDADRRFDIDVQRQQQAMLENLGTALPLLRQAGHDVSVAEIIGYIEGPVSGYRNPRPYTTVASSGTNDARSTVRTLHIVSYQRYEITGGHERIIWGRACATVTIDTVDDTIRTKSESCPTALPVTGPLPPTLSAADLDATETPVALAVAEATRASNVSELRRVLHDNDGPGVAFGG